MPSQGHRLAGTRGQQRQAAPPFPGLCQPLAPPGHALTFLAAARAHAGLEVLGVGAGDAEVQLRLEHALPHPLAFVTGGGAAGGPRGPVGVDAGFGGVIWNEYVTGFPGEPVATGAGPTPTPAHLGIRRSRHLTCLSEPGSSWGGSSYSLAFKNYILIILVIPKQGRSLTVPSPQHVKGSSFPAPPSQ